jgi:ribonuclease HI
MSKKKYYAVAVGRKPGIYLAWEGDQGAAGQVQGFPEARYKGFASLADAQTWLANYSGAKIHPSPPVDELCIYTDGSCLSNPGPGGYGVVILKGNTRRELSAGYSLTTNSRMELMAAIAALQALQGQQIAVIYTDSSYLVNTLTKGWAARWQANDWMRNKYQKVANIDLWEQLLSLTKKHSITFHWVAGHAGHPENERCDHLARQAASLPNLPPDPGYLP